MVAKVAGESKISTSQNENILAFGQLANVNVKPCLTQYRRSESVYETSHYCASRPITAHPFKVIHLRAWVCLSMSMDHRQTHLLKQG